MITVVLDWHRMTGERSVDEGRINFDVMFNSKLMIFSSDAISKSNQRKT